MPLLMDASEATLSALMERRLAMRAAGRGILEIQSTVDQVIRKTGGSATVKLQGIEATRALSGAIVASEALLRQWSTAYSPAQWLWMLRRIPSSVFAGKLSSTLAYDLALATVLTGESPTRGGGRVQDRQLIYPVCDADAERVWRFCAGVRYLSHLHQAYRWANKGAEIQFQRQRFPNPEPTEALREAVERYDARMIASSTFLSHSGTIPYQEGGTGTTITGIVRVDPALTIPVPDLPGVPMQQVEVLAKFIPSQVDLEHFLEMLLHEEALRNAAIAKEVASLCCLLAALYDLVLQHRMLPGVLQRGYLLWGRERLPQALTDAFSRLSPMFRNIAAASGISCAEDWIGALHAIGGSAWPLMPGPIMRAEGDMVLLDLYFATMRLNTLIGESTREGAVANTRARLFETRVQAAIDASAWRPEQALGDFRGRALRRDGKDFTDIDAIGVCADQLLLVSCKSAIYSPQYDAGDFNAIRNRADLVIRSVREWDTKVASLRAQPIGDNFDFSSFSEIVGVVCTPLPVFVSTEPTTSMVPASLSAACSFGELEHWLSNGSAPHKPGH